MFMLELLKSKDGSEAPIPVKVVDCYLTPRLQYCSYIITRTSYK